MTEMKDFLTNDTASIIVNEGDDLMTMDDFVSGEDELSACWFDSHDDLTPGDLEKITDFNESLSFDDGIVFDEDMFEDCEKMEVENHAVFQNVSCSPSTTQERKELKRQDSLQSLETTASNHLAVGDGLYSAAMNNLESSMRRSEMSRAQVLRHRDSLPLSPSGSSSCQMNFPPQQQLGGQGSSTTNNNMPARQQPLPSSFSGLAGLLSGKRTTLTADLERSRNFLRMYTSSISRIQPF